MKSMAMIYLMTDNSDDPIFVNSEFILFFRACSDDKNKTRITFINGDVLLAKITVDKLVDLLKLKRQDG